MLSPNVDGFNDETTDVVVAVEVDPPPRLNKIAREDPL
jgi:hypothetical protein